MLNDIFHENFRMIYSTIPYFYIHDPFCSINFSENLTFLYQVNSIPLHFIISHETFIQIQPAKLAVIDFTAEYMKYAINFEKSLFVIRVKFGFYLTKDIFTLVCFRNAIYKYSRKKKNWPQKKWHCISRVDFFFFKFNHSISCLFTCHTRTFSLFMFHSSVEVDRRKQKQKN